MNFDEVPILAPSLALDQLNDETIVLLGDCEHFVYKGRNVVAVAKLVDGRRSKSEVLMAAAREVGDLAALEAFERLEATGQLLVGVSETHSDSVAFWHAMGATLPRALERLRTSRIRIRAAGESVSRDVRAIAVRALRDMGLAASCEERVEGAADAAVLDLWIVDDYLNPRLEFVNREQLAARKPWCVVSVAGVMGFVGPVFAPDAGPCWACVAERARRNRPIHEYLKRVRRTEPMASNVASPTGQRMMLELAAIALGRAIADPGKPHPLAGRVMEVDFRTLEVRHQRLERRPQCPVCGDPGLMRNRATRPVELSAVAKAKPHEGGFRHSPPEQSYERLRHLVGGHLGAVTLLEPMPNWPPPMHVYVSAYIAAISDGESIGDCVRICAGKGRSKEQARVSAICEAIERRSGHFEGDEARVRGSLEQLGDAAVDPADLLNFSDWQYAERERLNAVARDRSQWVPERLGHRAAIDWTPAWSLRGNGRRYVPFSYCFSGAPVETGTSFCRPTGNGVAAGMCLEEAILQGLLELVERDAVAIWWYNRLRRPSISANSLSDPYLHAILEVYAMRGMKVTLFDLTHDLGIPVCAAVATHHHNGKEVVGMGFGCHLRRDLAIERAVTELSQIGNGIHPGTGKPFVDIAALDERAFLQPPVADARDIGAADWDGSDLRSDIEECVQRLARANLDVLVVDKSRPDLGVCVAQVIAPGLRHFWPRLGPGRLYDVPVQLGWARRRASEDELNPVPLLL